MTRLRDDFAALVAAGERTELARAALAIARIGHPALDPAPSLHRLDGLAAAVRPRLVAGVPPASAAAEVAHHLFAELRFRGNRGDYYDPRNSYLNDVLERRTGIPITLSVVMIEVAARLGLRLDGVGFPGHFLVRVVGADPPVLLDPFFGGRPVDDAELLSRYRALGARDAAHVPPEALERTSTPAILLRMLRNLLHVHLERKDRAHALHTADLVLVLSPRSADDHRVRGMLYEDLECFAAALDDFRAYLELAPDAPDTDRIRERIARLVRVAATIH
jgi:regulator of sirC expression with transglutaminase-like and TPR domain